MIILLYSLIVAVIIFYIYYYINAKNEEEYIDEYEEPKSMFTIQNLVIFCIIYIFVFTLLYLAFDDGSSLISLGILENDYSKQNKLNKSNIVDPSIIKNTSEPMKSGFEPYNSSSSDDSDISDSSTSDDNSDSN
jgi:hypothetical protein